MFPDPVEWSRGWICPMGPQFDTSCVCTQVMSEGSAAANYRVQNCLYKDKRLFSYDRCGFTSLNRFINLKNTFLSSSTATRFESDSFRLVQNIIKSEYITCPVCSAPAPSSVHNTLQAVSVFKALIGLVLSYIPELLKIYQPVNICSRSFALRV